MRRSFITVVNGVTADRTALTRSQVAIALALTQSKGLRHSQVGCDTKALQQSRASLLLGSQAPANLKTFALRQWPNVCGVLLRKI